MSKVRGTDANHVMCMEGILEVYGTIDVALFERFNHTGR